MVDLVVAEGLGSRQIVCLGEGPKSLTLSLPMIFSCLLMLVWSRLRYSKASSTPFFLAQTKRFV